MIFETCYYQFGHFLSEQLNSKVMSSCTCRYQTFFDPSGRKTTGCFSRSGPACKNEIKQKANKKGPAWDRRKEKAGPALVPKTLLYIPEISSSILPCLRIMFIVSRSVFRILQKSCLSFQRNSSSILPCLLIMFIKVTQNLQNLKSLQTFC